MPAETTFVKPLSSKPNTPGILRCLSCQKPFKSWDVKKNRLCSKCAGETADVVYTRHAYVKGAQ